MSVKSLSDYLIENDFINLSIYCFSTNASTQDGLEREISIFVERDQVFIFAMTLFEYADKVYVEKIDSSSSSNKGLYSAIVQGVLNSFNKRIHIFARAQPQLLFPNSKNNSQKNIQTERNLVRWWARTLSGLQVEKGWYYVPGECQNSTKDIISLLKNADSDDAWEFGWPWKEEDSVGLIPVFPDDPKFKCIKLLDNKSTIKEFQTMLQVTGECGSGRFSGFFILDPKIPKTTIEITAISNDDYQLIFKRLMNLDFSTMEKTKLATNALKELFKEIHVQSIQVVEQKDKSIEVSRIPLEKKRLTEAVVLASNLIKKKKKSSKDF